MNLLILGDIMGASGRKVLNLKLPDLSEQKFPNLEPSDA